MKAILDSLKATKEGFSARKIVALHLMLLLTVLDWKYAFDSGFEAFTTVIAIHLIGVLIALGIVTAQQVIDFKNGNDQDDGDK